MVHFRHSFKFAPTTFGTALFLILCGSPVIAHAPIKFLLPIHPGHIAVSPIHTELVSLLNSSSRTHLLQIAPSPIHAQLLSLIHSSSRTAVHAQLLSLIHSSSRTAVGFPPVHLLSGDRQSSARVFDGTSSDPFTGGSLSDHLRLTSMHFVPSTHFVKYQSLLVSRFGSEAVLHDFPLEERERLQRLLVLAEEHDRSGSFQISNQAHDIFVTLSRETRLKVLDDFRFQTFHGLFPRKTLGDFEHDNVRGIFALQSAPSPIHTEVASLLNSSARTYSVKDTPFVAPPPPRSITLFFYGKTQAKLIEIHELEALYVHLRNTRQHAKADEVYYKARDIFRTFSNYEKFKARFLFLFPRFGHFFYVNPPGSPR